MEEIITRPTRLLVDLNNFKYNVEQIKKMVALKGNAKIMPVIKGNCYGTYINKITEIMNEFEIVAVAIVDEGVELRKQGYKNEIFVLNQAYKDEIDKIVKYNISVGTSSKEFISELGKCNEEIKIHLEIGTGMGRTGINPNRTEEYINYIKEYPNIKVEGIYTHLSSADEDYEYTNKQLASFKVAVDKATNILGDIKYIHASASNGILNFPDSYYTLVRPGIILYGYESCPDMKDKIDLKPVCKLKSKVTFLKEVGSGISIGYSRSYKTTKETKVATIPIGYADGLDRMLSNKGYIVINGQKAPIIGKICMDSFMADVTDLKTEAKVGDDIYIWDNDLITLEEVANVCDTINYEIMSTISSRVPREFIK